MSRGAAALPPCTPLACWITLIAPSDPAPFIPLALLASLTPLSPLSLVEVELDMVKKKRRRRKGREKNKSVMAATVNNKRELK